MQAGKDLIVRFEIDDADITEQGNGDALPQIVDVEVLPPIDITDKRKVEIYKGITEANERLSLISERVEELNSEIDCLTNHADGLDYAVSVISGIISGIVDSLFVGETEIDKDKIQKFLEDKYHTANDSGYKHKGDDGHWTSSATYHRLDDLAHHPTIAGLVASILVRYFRLVIFIDGTDGKPHIFFADTSSPKVTASEKKELLKAWIGAIIGGLCIWLSDLAIKKYEESDYKELPEPLKKLIKAVGASPMMLEVLKAADVWGGHMMSDVSTSQGVPGILLSFLKEISALPIIRNTGMKDWVDDLYNEGDMNLSERGGVIFVAAKKQSLPILINEALVRGLFFIIHLAEELRDKKDLGQVDWNRVIPFKNRTVARMFTISTTTFMAFDIADAAIRSRGFNSSCVLRLNFVGMGRFAVAVGTDVGMGIKKIKKERERSEAIGEYMGLVNMKIYYRKADLLCSEAELHEQEASMYSAQKDIWQEVQYTNEAIEQLYEQINRTCQYYQKAISHMDECLKDIGSLMPHMDKVNPGLREKMLERLKNYEG